MKTVSIISIAYGVLGLIWGTVVSVILKIESALFSNMPFPEEVQSIMDVPALMEALNGIWQFLLPFILVIAVIYILSGILHLTGKQQSRSLIMIAAILNIIWYLVYIYVIQSEMMPLLAIEEFFPMKYLNMMVAFGMVFNGLFYCGYPIFLLVFLSQRNGKN